MEMAQRIVLAQGLARKFKETQERGQIDDLLNRPTSSMNLVNLPQLTMMAFLGVMWCATVWSLFHFQYHGLYSLFVK
jgi:hypothetical protein